MEQHYVQQQYIQDLKNLIQEKTAKVTELKVEQLELKTRCDQLKLKCDGLADQITSDENNPEIENLTEQLFQSMNEFKSFKNELEQCEKKTVGCLK